MTRYHIDPSSGTPRVCEAEKGGCPYNSVSDHYSSKTEAYAAYEAKQGGGLVSKLSKGSFLKRAVTAGAMTVVAFSVVGCSNIGSQDLALPYDSPVEPPVAEAPPSAPTAEEQDWSATEEQLRQLYEDGKNWTQENGPSISEEAQRLWSELGQSPEGGAPSTGTTQDSSGVYWQGGNLVPEPSEVAEAQRILDTLVVEPEGSSFPYDRAAQYGRGFETGKAGAVEHRDVPNATFKNSSPQARVVDGYFMDPYTGEQVHVIGGESYDADIDHVVPLSEAHRSGADEWAQEKRVQFANDMSNLVYTASGVNRSKGDKDPAEWMPSYLPAQCRYAVATIQIKGSYGLSVDNAEKQALQNTINSRCVS